MASGQIVAKDAFVTINGSNMGGDTNTSTLSRTVETPDVTAYGDTNRQRITGGLRDWSFTSSVFFNDDTGGIETAMDNNLGATVVLIFGPGGSQSGYQSYSGCGIVSEYSVESPVDGVTSMSYTVVASSGSLTSGSFA